MKTIINMLLYIAGKMSEVEQPQEVTVEKMEEVSVEGKEDEEPEDEWVDILGSGDLKKKVRTSCVTLGFIKWRNVIINSTCL